MIDWKEFIPFILVTENGIKLNKVRVVEAILIAVITASVTTYITTERLRVQVEDLKHRIERLENVILFERR